MMENIIELLHPGSYSCVIVNRSDVRTFNQHGVADLYALHLYDRQFLKGAVIADKVVGIAAATLMISGGVKQVHADIISLPAMKLLRDAHLDVTASLTVPVIENRDYTDWCPLEKACLKAQSYEEIMPLIDRFMLVQETKKLTRN